jgi:hypothetical protein
MMRLPLALFSLGVEMFASSMREFQRTLTNTMDAPTGFRASTEGPRGETAGKRMGENTMPNWSRSDQRDYNGAGWSRSDQRDDNGERPPWCCEPGVAGYDMQPGGEQDLCGTDLKYVEYSILFTKRDLETTLQREDNEVVDYSTNGASFGGLKVGKFLAKWNTLNQGKGIDRPQLWRDRNYPSTLADPDYVQLDELPDSDTRYIAFVYRVKNRLCKQTKEYDRLEVEALREIAERISRVRVSP